MRTSSLLLLLLAAAVPATVEAQTSTGRDAKAVYEQGARHYDGGEYDAAIADFKEAYSLSHAPGLLFNLAQAYRLKGPGSCAEALRAYQRYLDEDPGTSNRGEVEERIREMRECVARSSPASRPATEPAETAPPRDIPRARRPSRLPLWIGGVGLALGIAGTALYFSARAKFSDVESSCPCPPGAFSGWERATQASYGLLVAGGAAVAAAVVLWVWDMPRRTHRHATLAPSPQGLFVVGTY